MADDICIWLLFFNLAIIFVNLSCFWGRDKVWSLLISSACLRCSLFWSLNTTIEFNGFLSSWLTVALTVFYKTLWFFSLLYRMKCEQSEMDIIISSLFDPCNWCIFTAKYLSGFSNSGAKMNLIFLSSFLSYLMISYIDIVSASISYSL